MSKQRDEIIRILNSCGNHMTAEEIFLECKKQKVSISLATIYRNLGILVEKGILRKISMIGEPDRYDTTLTDHEHVICEECKDIRDICLKNITRDIEEELNMPILNYDLCIRYICPECRQSRKEI